MTDSKLPLHRYRVFYKRGAELRYVSHLDMQTVWIRSLRRSRLPIAYSQGFTPLPRLHLASALPLGFFSEHELVDFWVNGPETPFTPDEIQNRLQPSVPPGLHIQTVTEAPLSLPALQTQVLSARYSVTLLESPFDFPQLQAAIEALLAQPEIKRQRRGKEYDLRPLILSLTGLSTDHLEMHLSAKEGATGRPEEVLDALGLDPTAARFTRNEIILMS